MADSNIKDALKNLNKNLKEADTNLATLSKNFHTVFADAVRRASQEAGADIGKIFDAMAGKVGAGKANKLKMLFEIVDEHGNEITPQKLKAKIDRIENASVNKEGTKIHLGFEWVDYDKAMAQLEHFKQQYRMLKDLPGAYDTALRLSNQTVGGATAGGTALGRARAKEMENVQKYTKLANQELERQQKIEQKIAEIQARGGKSAQFEGERRSIKQLNDMLEESKRQVEAYKRTLRGLGSRGQAAAAGFGGDGSKTAIKIQTERMRELYNLTKQYRQMQEQQRSGKFINPQDLEDTKRRLREILADMKRIEAEHPGSRKTAAARLETERLRDRWREVNKETKSVKSSFASLLPMVQRLAAAFGVAFSVQGLVQFGKKLIETTGKFQEQQVAIRSILSNKEVADDIWRKTMQLALQSPFSAMQLTKYTKQLAAYRIENDKLYDTTKRLADVSAGLGVDMQRLILAYGQVKAANYLRASEIRQFTEAGVNILGELARYFSEIEHQSVTTAQVMDRVQKRIVTFGDVEQIFKRLTDAGGTFYNMQLVQSRTVRGQINKLHDAYDQMLYAIGQSKQGTINDLIQLALKLVRNWRAVATALTSIGFGAVAGAALHLVLVLKKVEKQSKLTQIATQKLGLSFSNLKKFITGNWISLSVAAIAALATAIFGAFKNMNAYNRELLESASELNKTRENFKNYQTEIEKNNEILKEGTADSKEYNNAKEENRLIIEKLKMDYPELADGIKQETNGIIEGTVVLEKYNERLSNLIKLRLMGEQKGILSEGFKKDMEELAVDVAKLQGDLINAQTSASMIMTKAETNGEEDNPIYKTLKSITEIDLSDPIRALNQYNKLYQEYLTLRQLHTAKLKNEKSKDFKKRENAFNDLLPKVSSVSADYNEAYSEFESQAAMYKKIIEENIMSVNEYAMEINTQRIKPWEWLIGNIERVKEDTKAGISDIFADVRQHLLDEASGNIQEMQPILNKMFNELLVDPFMSNAQRYIIDKSADSVAFLASMGIIPAIEYANNQVDLFLTRTKSATDVYTPPKTGAGANKSASKLISLIREMRAEYDKLSKSAYGYTKSEDKVRESYRQAVRDILVKKAGVSENYDFTTNEGMIAALEKVKAYAKKLGPEAADEVEKYIGQLKSEMEINVQVRLREDFARQMEDALNNYELTLDLQKLNLPSGLAAELWGINETDLADLRASLSTMYEGLKDEKGELSAESIKQYEQYLNKIDDIERKQQRERLKDYSKYLEYQYSERVKLEMEYVRKIAQLEAESGLTSEQKAAIREGIDKEYREKSRKQDWEDFKGSEFYVQMMEDLERHSTASLEVMRARLLQMRENAENLYPRALKEVVNALEKIDKLEAQRKDPFVRWKEALDAMKGTNMEEVYKELSEQQDMLSIREDQMRQMESMIALEQERNKLILEGYDLEEARVQLKKAEENLKSSRYFYDNFSSDGGNNSEQTRVALEEAVSKADEDVEKWKEIIRILSGQAAIDLQAQGNPFSRSSLPELMKARKALKDEIENLQKGIGGNEELVKKQKELQDATQAMLESLKEWAQSVGSVFDGIMDNVDYFSDKTYGMVGAWKEFGGTVVTSFSDIVSGIQAYKKAMADSEKDGNLLTGLFTANGLKLALVAVGVILKLIQAIAKLHDSNIDKQIQQQQERIDALKDAYERLEKQIEKTFTSVSYMKSYNDMVENIRQQIEALEAQLSYEEAKKNSDTSAVSQYRSDIQSAYNQLEELEQKQIEVFGGIGGESNYRSAAEEFVSAWKDAFLDTGDGLDALKDHFDEFLQDWFVKQVTLRIASSMLQPLFEEIDNAVSPNGPGGVDVLLSELENIGALKDTIFPQLSNALEQFAGMFNLQGEGGLSGLAAGIQGMTEEQANVLEAYWNSVRMYVSDIDGHVERIAAILGAGGSASNPMLQNMQLIEQNTKATLLLLKSTTKSNHPMGGFGFKVFND